jgi:hypothetical protein
MDKTVGQLSAEAVPALAARVAELEAEVLDRNGQIVRLGEQSTSRLEALIAAEAREARLREALTGIKRASKARMDSYGDEHSYYYSTASAALTGEAT